MLPPSNSCALFTALPASMSNKVLVQMDCASHGLIFEGGSYARCAPGGGVPWDGPRATMAPALIEWILDGTFRGASGGRFHVDAGGVVTAGTPACPG